MFSIFSYIMSRVTHSEPGLPMLSVEEKDLLNSGDADNTTILAAATT